MFVKNKVFVLFGKITHAKYTISIKSNVILLEFQIQLVFHLQIMHANFIRITVFILTNQLKDNVRILKMYHLLYVPYNQNIVAYTIYHINLVDLLYIRILTILWEYQD